MFKPELIELEAQRLDSAAQIHMVLWSLLGFGIGALVFLGLQHRTDFAVVLGLVPFVICVAIAEGRARQFRLQSQTLRLNLQIEWNTRHLVKILEALTKS